MVSPSYEYGKRWRYERDHGLTRLVDPTVVIDHINALEAEGWSQRSIADAAGVSVQCVSRLSKRMQAKVSRDAARKILAVTGEAISRRPNSLGFVLKVGAVRRIQALLAIGHRHADITAAMREQSPGIGTTSQLVMHQVGRWTTRGTHDTLRAVYDVLSMRPGSSERTRVRAARSGYLPPLAWDDATIDDPYGEPAQVDAGDGLDEIAVERLMRGQLQVEAWSRAPERVEAIRRLAADGLTDMEIGDRIGMGRDAVLKIRSRNNIASPFTPAANSGASQQIDGIAARYGASEAVDPATLRRPPAA